MEGPRLTEERLRNHLDSNQVMRERMCLAVLPLLGPFTQEKPRRPKGGRDGGRDIECIYQRTTLAWGAVGFRNGGGADDSARKEAEGKFKEDLGRALGENPSLEAFVFFTNVDLTPTQRETLVKYAHGKNVKTIEIFDMERLRHVLDSPEGLIARLQYLDIPMSATEQAGLVAKFGNQLQNAVTARFDRVERTLAQMERFLEYQKPLLRMDVFIELDRPATSVMIGDQAVLMRLQGIHGFKRSLFCLCINVPGRPESANSLLSWTRIWVEENPQDIVSEVPCKSALPNVMTSATELSLRTIGGPVRLADITIIRMEAFCTEGIRDKIRRISVDANGYELFSCVPDGSGETASLTWPSALGYNAAGAKWVSLMTLQNRNVLFSPLNLSGRFAPLTITPDK